MKKGLQMQMWEFLIENPRLTTKEMSIRMNVCYDRVRNHAAKMLKKGYLSRESKSGVGVYSAATKPIRVSGDRLSTKLLGANTKQSIYTHLLDNENLTSKEISEQLRIQLSSVRNRLKDLEDEGAVLSSAKKGQIKKYKAVQDPSYLHLKQDSKKTVEDVLSVAKLNGGGVFGLMAAQLT